jgi:Holliday junction resolvase RusA-like endonuclease
MGSARSATSPVRGKDVATSGPSASRLAAPAALAETKQPHRATATTAAHSRQLATVAVQKTTGDPDHVPTTASTRARTVRQPKGLPAFLAPWLALLWLVGLLRLWDRDDTDSWEAIARGTAEAYVDNARVRGEQMEADWRAATAVDVAFFVPGIPAAQGNKQAFRNKYSGKVAIVERTAGNPHWRQDVRDAFDQVRRPGQEPLTGPLGVSLRFIFSRPKSHYNSKGEWKPTAPKFMTSRPDVDKLQRALLDAIQVPTGGSVIAEDALVAAISATKEYGERPGVFVEVRRLA